MMKALLAIFLVLLGVILLNRYRVYVRDPLATVYLNGAKQSGYEVYINYNNDVLVIHPTDKLLEETLVQGWNKMPAIPQELRCMRYMACLADADHATTLPLDGAVAGKYKPDVAMSNREVSYALPDGTKARIDLR